MANNRRATHTNLPDDGFLHGDQSAVRDDRLRPNATIYRVADGPDGEESEATGDTEEEDEFEEDDDVDEDDEADDGAR